MDPTTLIPAFGGLLWTIAAFIVALSIIVAVHEYGHYIVGRWSGIKAEVFSIGFGPVLFARTDRHGTQWQIAALPFGGYVKFLGDASAASDKASEDYDTLPEAEKRHTMHGAPLWARAATVAAGPVFNFILSIVVFALVATWQGQIKEPLEVAALRPLPVEAPRLAPGDRVVAVAGQDTPDAAAFYAVTEGLPASATVTYTVERDGRLQEVEAAFPFPPLIDRLAPRSAAMDAGLEEGDIIRAVDGEPITAFFEFKQIVETSEGRPLRLEVWRPAEADRPDSPGTMLEFVLVPRPVDEPREGGSFERVWRIGMAGGLVFERATEGLGPVEAVSAGVSRTADIIVSSFTGLAAMITGQISTCNLSGPVGIAETSGALASSGLLDFILWLGILSTAVGFLNLLPIPVLDGGHLLFHAYEAATGRPPSDGVLRVLMTAGLALLLTFMVFAIANDIVCP